MQVHKIRQRHLLFQIGQPQFGDKVMKKRWVCVSCSVVPVKWLYWILNWGQADKVCPVLKYTVTQMCVISARYQRAVDPVVSAATAQRFYHQAFMLFPEIGTWSFTLLSSLHALLWNLSIVPFTLLSSSHALSWNSYTCLSVSHFYSAVMLFPEIGRLPFTNCLTN